MFLWPVVLLFCIQASIVTNTNAGRWDFQAKSGVEEMFRSYIERHQGGLTKTYLPAYLWDSSDSSDINYSSESSDRSDSSDFKNPVTIFLVFFFLYFWSRKKQALPTYLTTYLAIWQ